MTNVLFTRAPLSEIENTQTTPYPVTDGQLLFDTSGSGKMYMDVGTQRLEMGGAMTIDSKLNSTSTNPIQNKAVGGVMLSTLDEINATTSKGFITDVLATKALAQKIGTTDISSIGDGSCTGAVDALNAKTIPVTFLSIMANSYASLHQSGKHITGLLVAVNDTPKNKLSINANLIAGIGNTSSDKYYYAQVASVLGNPFGLTASQYTCVGTSLDRANSSSGTDLSIVPGLALALYNGTDTLLYCSVGGGSLTYHTTRYLIWIDYLIV